MSLFIFAGLPGTGKSALAERLAARVGAAYLRIDTIEQGLRDLFGVEIEREGYALAYRIAADNLRAGRHVVADSCNPVQESRRGWERVARDQRVPFVNIEVVCSDVDEHRRRVEGRSSTVPGLRLPVWQDVLARRYECWDGADDRIVIDTANRSIEAVLEELCDRLPR